MGLLQKLKAVLGLDGTSQPPRASDPDVTVEREPSAGSERAVKGVDEPADAPPAPRSASASATEPDESSGDAGGDAPSVREIEGIGPTYGDRLEAAGLETMVDLAASDAATVAQAAEASESRARDWIERAQDH